MNAYDYRIFLAVPRQWDHGRSTLDALSVRYLVQLNNSVYPPTQRIEDFETRKTRTCSTILTLSPRAWIVHHVKKLPHLSTPSPAAIRNRTERVLLSKINKSDSKPEASFRDLSKMSVVETDSEYSRTDKRLVPEYISSTDESCQIVEYQPQHVVIDVELTTPGLVVLSDLYYPGWKAQVSAEHLQTPQTVPILRTNRVMRGIYLPAGRFRIDYRYRPTRFYTGAMLSSAAWVLLIVLGTIAWQRKRQPNSGKSADKSTR